MRDGGGRNWRQMEWIGWWFEFFTEKTLASSPGFTRGPKYGNVEFDLAGEWVWDLKAHPDEAGSKVPLNDQEAVIACIQDHGGLGYILIEGSADYESIEQEFKHWHDALKGKKTAYQKKNEAAGRPSRRRKSVFRPDGIRIIWIPALEDLEMGKRDGWISAFQEGMINSNGTARRAKFMLDLAKVPSKYVLVYETL
ncbi:MAG: hypothetical protein RL645_1362 [Actinomycetota bacterium]